MTVLRARWVLPVAGAPIAHGWVAVQGGRVRAVGHGRPPAPARDLGDVALLPGLVNAHTHLELSWMAGLVPSAASMGEWIRALLQVRRVGPARGNATVIEAMTAAVSAMRATGTVLVGDISNTLVSASVLARDAMDSVVFHELLGFNPIDPAGQVRAANELVADLLASAPNQLRAHFAVVGHAPYSTAPALFAEIAVRHEGPAPLSVHLAESAEEVEFLHTGRGPFRDLLMQVGVWNPLWEAPHCGPVEYLRRLGYLKPGTLLVHGVHLTMDEMEQARDAEAVVVTCPRSNARVGGGVPPIARFFSAGVDVAVGTDSLASVDSLNMFDELAALRRLAPEVDAARLLDSATRAGANALGFGQDYGTISVGRVARLVTVALPGPARARGTDVEEYLVGGVPAEDVAPLDLTTIP